MNIPPIQGKRKQSGFFIYAAADAGYFDKHGIPLINSVLRNTEHGIHLHLYNPRQDQIDCCNNTPRVSVTWETLEPSAMQSAIDFWKSDSLPDRYQRRKEKMLGLKQYAQTGNDLEQLTSWLWKTYYACMRFVRLSQIIGEPVKFLAIDVDGLVRAPFLTELPDSSKCDFHLYEKEKGGYLAGALLFNNTMPSLQFIHHLAQSIRTEIEKDNIYWFLDQYTMELVVPNYNSGLLPKSYIDWHMNADSAIWSAKGKRKELAVFKQEQQKYL